MRNKTNDDAVDSAAASSSNCVISPKCSLDSTSCGLQIENGLKNKCLETKKTGLKFEISSLGLIRLWWPGKLRKNLLQTL
uniref:Uncharacterized protein n=1 Tax=Strigamia maritima TaxID=126957 RepID=T1J7W9_STRMM